MAFPNGTAAAKTIRTCRNRFTFQSFERVAEFLNSVDGYTTAGNDFPAECHRLPVVNVDNENPEAHSRKGKIRAEFGVISMNSEQRRSPRHHIELPLRILEIDGVEFELAAQTRDVSSGGVRFLTATEIVAGRTITYLLTLSSGSAPVQIRCVGKVLRCSQAEDAPQASPWEVAVQMERYSFTRHQTVKPEAVAV